MANDIIYIKKINNRYWVWMANESERNPKPAKCDAKFFERADATRYANDWRMSAQSRYVIKYLSL